MLTQRHKQKKKLVFQFLTVHEQEPAQSKTCIVESIEGMHRGENQRHALPFDSLEKQSPTLPRLR